MLAVCAIAALGCKSKPKAGPPSKLNFRYATGNGSSIKVEGDLIDAEFNSARSYGTLTYTIYEGPPANNKVLCTTSRALTDADYQFEGSGLFSAMLTFSPPCKPPMPAADIRYGLIKVVDPASGELRDEWGSQVPEELGGTGIVDDTRSYDQKKATNATATADAKKRDAVLAALPALAALKPEALPPIDAPCPRDRMPKDLTFALPSTLAGIAAAYPMPIGDPKRGASFEPAVGSVLFESANDTPFRDLAVWTAGDAKKYQDAQKAFEQMPEAIGLVQVGTFEPPRLVGAGGYAGATLFGELWVVDLAAKTVICRGKLELVFDKAFKVQSNWAQGDLDDYFMRSTRREIFVAMRRMFGINESSGLLPAAD
jgi:hypothetical protein